MVDLNINKGYTVFGAKRERISSITGFSTDVLVPPSLMKQMKQILKDFNIDHSIVIEDVEKLIKVQNQKSRTHRGYNGKINFKEYYSHDDVSKIENSW